ncbi:MAG: hypothetical protein KC657_38045, partial [Myxococcales bacterium]|nr:hypothetical protein [Myxococcales bacterium]
APAFAQAPAPAPALAPAPAFAPAFAPAPAFAQAPAFVQGHPPPPPYAPAQAHAPAPPPQASPFPPAPPVPPRAPAFALAQPPLPPELAPTHPLPLPQTFSPPPVPPPLPATRRSSVPEAAPQLPALDTSAPFDLEPHKDDTALLRDRRAGFSHLLPGRPSLGTVRPSDGPADAVVHLQDAPITVRYKLEKAWERAQSASEAALVAARHIATLRATGDVHIDHANETWLASWGVEAAAVCNYELEGGTREDLFVLARDGQVLIVTWSYPAGLVEDPAYASFASIAEATMVWDHERWDQRGRVWPESPFLGAGLYGAPRAVHNEACRQLALLPIGDDERVHLLTVLSGIVSTAGAPWLELRDDLHDAHRRALLSGTRHPTMRAWIETAMSEVRTCHDLRGMAVMLGRAIERRRTSSPPPLPVRANRA